MLTPVQQMAIYKAKLFWLGLGYLRPNANADGSTDLERKITPDLDRAISAVNPAELDVSIRCFETDILFYYLRFVANKLCALGKEGHIQAALKSTELEYVYILAMILQKGLGVEKDEAAAEKLLVYISEFSIMEDKDADTVANRVAKIYACDLLGDELGFDIHAKKLEDMIGADSEFGMREACLASVYYKRGLAKQELASDEVSRPECEDSLDGDLDLDRISDYDMALIYAEQAIQGGASEGYYYAGICTLLQRQRLQGEYKLGVCKMPEVDFEVACGRYLVKAESLFEAAVAQKFPPAYPFLGYSFERQGGFEKAELLYQEGARLGDASSVKMLGELEAKLAKRVRVPDHANGVGVFQSGFLSILDLLRGGSKTEKPAKESSAAPSSASKGTVFNGYDNPDASEKLTASDRQRVIFNVV
jgi:TPR repeat protein